MSLCTARGIRPATWVGHFVVLCGIAAGGCARPPRLPANVSSEAGMLSAAGDLETPFVRTSDTTYVVLARPGLYEVDIPVTYANRGRDTVWLQGCTYSLDRYEAGGWRGVYAPACQAVALRRTAMPPGASRAWTMTLRLRDQPRVRPRFVGPVPGVYRIALAVFDSPRPGEERPDTPRPVAERVSNRFRFIERPAP